MFSRQHFEFVAEALRVARPFTDDSPDRWGGWYTTVVTVAQQLQNANPRFDRERFNRAAGLVDERGAVISRYDPDDRHFPGEVTALRGLRAES